MNKDLIKILASFDSAKLRRIFYNLPAKTKNILDFWFAKYFEFFLRYIVKNKLSGQVLGKYRGAMNSLSNRSRMLASTKGKGTPAGLLYMPGRYKRTILEKSRVIAGALQAFVYATIYGKAWEYGFHRRQYTIKARHSTTSGRPGYLMWWNGSEFVYRRSVTIPAQRFDEKPHIRPSIIETRPQFMSMVFRKLLNALLGKSVE